MKIRDLEPLKSLCTDSYSEPRVLGLRATFKVWLKQVSLLWKALRSFSCFWKILGSISLAIIWMLHDGCMMVENDPLSSSGILMQPLVLSHAAWQ